MDTQNLITTGIGLIVTVISLIKLSAKASKVVYGLILCVGLAFVGLGIFGIVSASPPSIQIVKEWFVVENHTAYSVVRYNVAFGYPGESRRFSVYGDGYLARSSDNVVITMKNIQRIKQIIGAAAVKGGGYDVNIGGSQGGFFSFPGIRVDRKDYSAFLKGKWTMYFEAIIRDDSGTTRAEFCRFTSGNLTATVICPEGFQSPLPH